ncbi:MULTISPECIES: type II toxin-antitoxin system RelE/ParE family toxin [unclassified Nostoc]|uniref:type II toxin-antitoxin system RelE/ParE family toxin n=1 Tax=unclassified Nostoc TaxID=2593658 RepID=UPI0013D26CA1|nr:MULTISPECIES: type II toxin-antitoxin system RelE/ParE family toxin [unclassified Nostoc]NEU83789.1 type II toxin-antitoxin system RelE/ParE family toxin [Nostoc sp. UIC 10630]QLE54040.1 type II toxin-antitoxin system RelE/ParE family toxin [Nostoc sp. C057]
MKIYKNRTFDRWARKEGLNNLSLCNAVNEMAAGLYDADLGGGLFKKRIAKPGKGKSGGFRTLVATNNEDRWFFIFGFSKNERSNIDKDEEEALKMLSKQLLAYTHDELEQAKNSNALIEVICNASEEISNS